MSASYHEKLSAIRQEVRRILRLRQPAFQPDQIREAILLGDSRVVGHQFQWSGTTIRWLAQLETLRVVGEGPIEAANSVGNPPQERAA